MIKRALVVTALAAALVSGHAGVAFAEAGEQAACVGLDASANAPVNERVHELQQVFSPFGGFVRQAAQLHEGTDEDCMEALLGGGD